MEKTSKNKEAAQLGIGAISSRLSSANQKELQKCKDSPVYFYNKYVRKDGQKELTEAEYNDFVKQVEYQRNMPLKLRKHYKDRPLLPSECFENMNEVSKEIQGNEANTLLASVNSSGKLKNECLFCGSRFCYDRVVSLDLQYDEVACMKHVKDLHKHSDIVAPKTMKQFISSTAIQKRGVPFNEC